MNSFQWLAHAWHYVVFVLTFVLSVWASGHALLYRRDTRAATMWVGFIWLAPLIGAVLYFILGINRIKRRAILLRGDMENYQAGKIVPHCPAQEVHRHLPPDSDHLVSLAHATADAPNRPLLPGNCVGMLINGDETFPAMLSAIEQARHSVTLSTYIFDHDEAGLAFVKALSDAVKRGVEVRVLIDAAGTRYSWPPITGALKREGIRFARFLPTFAPWRLLSMNLRNHRKILVVDGRLGFTGGINIRAGNCLLKQPRYPVRDLHFRIEGPVVAQLQEVFTDDWLFTTGEALRGEKWFPPLEGCGPVLARGIVDGPDEDFEKLRWTILPALAAAKRSVRIATPYFLPDATLIAALNLAAMRGVQVDILLPSKSNLPFVQWASMAHWWQVLERGCRIWLSPPPFDHSKLLLVDDAWTLLGSANWDPRSLRLNFEFNVECYDPAVARTAAEWFDGMLRQSRQTTLAEVDARSLPIRVRDGIARLFTPFL